MAKKKRTKSKQQESGKTNWLLIGGGILLGVIAIFALLFLALREPETLTLTEYCAQNSDHCAVAGPENAPVTLVEVSDFGCPHCRDFHQQTAPLIKEQYVDTEQIKWVFLPYALRPETVPAANAAMCASEQGKYFEFSEALFSQVTVEESLVRDGFLAAGEEIGLDIEPFTSCLVDGRYNSIINQNQSAARNNRVSGTPTFFVNDQIMRGAQPFSEFQRVINSYLES